MSLILVVESSQGMARSIGRVLSAQGHECLLTQSVGEALSQAQERRPELVLSEARPGEGRVATLIEKLRDMAPDLPIVVASALGNEHLAAQVMLLGAFTYEVKDSEYLTKLPALVGRALAASTERVAAHEKDRQTRRLEAQSELSGWLSHNFKNILSASVGSLGLIDLSNPNQPKEKQAEYIDDCRRSLASALHLLGQLEEMTQKHAGDTEELLLGEEVDIAYSRVCQKMRKAARERGGAEAEAALKEKLEKVSFLNAARSLPPKMLNRRDLASILEALLENALEAVDGTEEPRILARAEVKSGVIELTIKDNGRGMSENVLRHATEPLFSTKGEVGVGLSLSLVQSLVSRHEGVFTLSSTPNSGAQATITFSDTMTVRTI